MASDKRKRMTAAQICAMLESQSAIWHRLYENTKAQDAALVASAIDDLLRTIWSGVYLDTSAYCGMASCHGSAALVAHLFPKKAGANG